jgi:hypothetical protein
MKLIAFYTAIAAAWLVVGIFFVCAANAETIRFYDASGRKVGSATTSGGGRTNYYNADGSSAGNSSTLRSGRTNYYGADGRSLGSATSSSHKVNPFFKGR